jgi:ATP-binding cassette subfamily F protein 3
VKNLPLEKARTFLGRFLFSGDDVFKMIGMLSGGERARVALAKLSLLEANFLLLDEPTHHLDLPSQELLQQVLADFDGTLLFVSHDRYFIDALATQVWVVDNGQLHAYRGNYSAYLEARAGEEVKRETPTRRPAAPRPRRDKKDEQLESEIAALEDRLTALSDALAEASTAQDVERVRQLGAQYQQVQEELEGRLGEWVTRSHNEA